MIFTKKVGYFFKWLNQLAHHKGHGHSLQQSLGYEDFTATRNAHLLLKLSLAVLNFANVRLYH